MTQAAASTSALRPETNPKALDAASHTAQRLLHATPEHLFLTTRRCFIGPIPEGWLLHHRKAWYKHHLHIHYSSHRAEFGANAEFGTHRRLTGLEGSSASAARASFPQPKDIDGSEHVPSLEEETVDAMDGNDPAQQATTAMPPAVAVPRSSTIGGDEADPQQECSEGVADVSDQQHIAQQVLVAQDDSETKDTTSKQTTSTNKNSRGISTSRYTAGRESSSATTQSYDTASEGYQTADPYNFVVPAQPSDTSQEAHAPPSLAELSTVRVYDNAPSPASSTRTITMQPASPSRRPLEEASRSVASVNTKDSRRVSNASFVTAREDSDDEVDDDGRDSLNELTPTATRVMPALDGTAPERPLEMQNDDPTPLVAYGSTSREPKRPSVEQHSSAMSLLKQINDGDSAMTQPSSAVSMVRNPPHDDHDFRGDSSAISLLKHTQAEGHDGIISTPGPVQGVLRKLKPKTRHLEPRAISSSDSLASETTRTNGTVRFGMSEGDHTGHASAHAEVKRRTRALRKLRGGQVHDGEIVRMEKMLVRIECTSHEVPADFDENDSSKLETRVEKRWAEYMVVCRESTNEGMDFVLQFYKTRHIPAVEGTGTKLKKGSAHNIELRKKDTHINLYSSLDKTMVLWFPSRKITRIFVMQPRAASSSMEWYTFLRGVLGTERIELLQINVPALAVNLRLENPFARLEESRSLAQATDAADEAIKRTMQEEHAAAANIIERCMKMLHDSPEWGDVVRGWSQRGLVGLAWKKYDRLEWVHGAHERKMYGTMAMLRSHELEIRAKEHYPTTVKDRGSLLVEPPPVEGFLIRLTSQRGVEQKLGRLFFKRLYFSTHNQFLIFNRPTAADPPPPPRLPMQQDQRIPTAHEIANKIPLIYSINPYPVKDGKIEWLWRDDDSVRLCDNDADDEQRRQVGHVLRCDGVVDLCRVVTVRNVHRGATPADGNVEEGSDVDFDQEVDDSHQDDGITTHFDDVRTFELVLDNGLVLRLQAYNQTTQREWMKRLRALVKYWRLRCLADTHEFRAVRQQNLERLNIDEDIEAFMGQYARKWEVSNSYASPELYHMCGLSNCRSMVLSGFLFRKSRLRRVFARSLVILSHGRLLVFRDAVRARSGRELPHIHHQRVAKFDLSNCYVYSGLITEGDLLYTAQGPGADGSHRSGRHALPRMYNDGWTSTDDDIMTCFVLWHNNSKGWFRGQKEAVEARDEDGRRRLKLVSRLGVDGRSIVFKARSRAERDHWVMSISSEIERLGQAEEVRLVGQKKSSA